MAKCVKRRVRFCYKKGSHGKHKRGGRKVCKTREICAKSKRRK